MTEATLGIGEVAREANVSVSAIRFYEREGLLPEMDGLIERARAMRDWLAVASACGCESLEDCPPLR